MTDSFVKQMVSVEFVPMDAKEMTPYGLRQEDGTELVLLMVQTTDKHRAQAIAERVAASMNACLHTPTEGLRRSLVDDCRAIVKGCLPLAYERAHMEERANGANSWTGVEPVTKAKTFLERAKDILRGLGEDID